MKFVSFPLAAFPPSRVPLSYLESSIFSSVGFVTFCSIPPKIRVNLRSSAVKTQASGIRGCSGLIVTGAVLGESAQNITAEKMPQNGKVTVRLRPVLLEEILLDAHGPIHAKYNMDRESDLQMTIQPHAINSYAY